MQDVILTTATPGIFDYRVGPHEPTETVMLEANGTSHWLAPAVARRVAEALLRAAARVDPRPIVPVEPGDPEHS
jgi:hypothetical protein